jgi:hypothetical protein
MVNDSFFKNKLKTVFTFEALAEESIRAVFGARVATNQAST